MSCRTVTTLFTDVVSSTELLERLGSEADDFHARHFAMLREAMAAHRGVEVKTTGDGAMAIFDSAGDALACAVKIQRDVVALNRRYARHRFDIRVGISAGDATERERDYFGPSVIQANRLCTAASGGQILVAEVVRLLAGGGSHRFEAATELRLKGLSEPVLAHELDWTADAPRALRVALADDSILLRKGIAELLVAEGIDVVAQADDADTLLEQLDRIAPDVIVLDVRMPPTYTTEGLDAAIRIREQHPEIGVLVLSQSVERGAARRLLEGGRVGYLLKDRVTDSRELGAAIRTVANGGVVVDPEVTGRT